MSKGEFKPVLKLGPLTIHQGDLGIVTGSLIVGAIIGYFIGKGKN